MTVVRIGVVALSVVLAVVTAVLGFLNRDTPIPASQSLGSTVMNVGFPIALLTFVAVGELICRRHPRHLVGWMFLALGLGAEVLLFVQNYGLYGTLTASGALPFARTMLWLSTWVWAIPVSALVVALLVFPDGRPISRGWWTIGWISAVSAVMQGLADAYRTPLVLTELPLDTPLGTPFPLDVLNAVSAIGTVAWSGAALAGGASLVIRFRRASGIERQQLKWVAYGSGIAVATFVIATFAYGIVDLGPIVAGLSALGILLIPISAALAILRYRLYDIDVVIERTLVYAALSASVAATYWLLVILLQSALRPITAGSELAVAASTLGTLALVQPFRTRIQRTVDRRFYRDRYDAARAVDRLTTELAGEVELGAVRASLLTAVGNTLQPAQTSLWLRTDAFDGRNDSRTRAG
jgi:hypothetical protein